MKKPEFQLITRELVARRREAVDPRWAHEPRAESFDLLSSRDGETPRGHANLALMRQWGSACAAADPDFVHAVSAWVFARGGRELNLSIEGEEAAIRTGLNAAGLSDPTSATPAARVISLAPSNAEVIHALGAFDRVVACEDSSDFPPQVLTLERLGPDLDPNLDRVDALKPDLVLSSLTVPGMERIVSGLRARGVPQMVLAPTCLDEVRADLRRVGDALGLSHATDTAVARFDAEREKLKAARPAAARRVYLEWWPRPMFTPGAACYSNELIELAGGINVFKGRPGASLEVATADLLAADPEICFVSWCGVAEDKLDPRRLIERPGLEQLSAVKAGQVFKLDEAFAGRPGPRVLEAARRMAARIAMLA